MSKFRLLIVAAILAALAHHSRAACESVQVNVLPLEVVEDHSMPSARLAAVTDGIALFGAVFAVFRAEAADCVVTAGYTDVVLRVASELQRNQCAFDHVREHELEHVRIYRDALATLAARIQARAGEADLVAVARQEVAAVRVAHRAHDSDDEYAKNRTACRGRILSLTNLR